ncbi:TPA: sodium ion-translocating decarboxylase subunit beta [Streptococcus pyogenes]|nr:sodium ion-translocating decarboxylase subunit beta [Streptococcus pyogenes]HES3728922.1 sodium ion-translocating decarboxylase subunit beta [Streptococcus pyogenes]HES7233518.1 sodium ion-translocating decarboxylase subunit beta [Streptococcus pyogenes]
MLDVLNQMVQSSGLAHLTINNLIMICLACFFLYLGIKKEYEPYLMVPIAFAAGTAGGVLMGKVMYYLSGNKVNPMIGAAGVSAVPMAARVVQKVGQEEDPSNFLLMHAMGPNVAGVIGSAIASGALLAFFG